MASQIQGVDDLNAHIAAIAADAFVDIAADPALTLDSATGYRTEDGVHFTRSGSNYITDTYYIPLIAELRE